MNLQALVTSRDESLITRLSTSLADIGVQLVSLQDADRALAALNCRRFEAVVVDCDVEGGMNLLEVVRGLPMNERTLVLAIVGSSEAMRSATRLGANFILSKPVNWEIAKRTLRAAKTMIIRERRHRIREAVQIPAKLKIEDKILSCTISDLSDGGLALKLPSAVATGKAVTVQFTLPGSANMVCKGTIAWSKGELSGVEFSGLSSDAANLILTWLERHCPRRAERATVGRVGNRAVDWGY